MSKLKDFYNFCKLFQQELDLEKKLKPIGLFFDGEGEMSQVLDGLLSMIPDLIFDEKGSALFWDLVCFNDDFSDEYIYELWEELKDYQL